MDAKFIIVMCTYPKDTGNNSETSASEANNNVNTLIEKILSEKLAACVNRAHNLTSSFIWQGKQTPEHEELLIIKTRKSLFTKLKDVIRDHHPYACPEIIGLPIIAIDSDYEAWLQKQTDAH